jgi:hypothetical protein
MDGAPERLWGLKKTGNGKGNRRSFDCGSRGEAARAFAQDDNFSGVRERSRQQGRIDSSDATDRFVRHCLVAGDGGINGAGPGVDASGEGLGVVETLFAEPHGYGERALAVVAEDDDGLVGVELGVGAGGDVAHGHGEAAEAGGFEFPGLADVEQEGWLGLVALSEVGFGGDFEFKHKLRIEQLLVGCEGGFW